MTKTNLRTILINYLQKALHWGLMSATFSHSSFQSGWRNDRKVFQFIFSVQVLGDIIMSRRSSTATELSATVHLSEFVAVNRRLERLVLLGRRVVDNNKDMRSPETFTMQLIFKLLQIECIGLVVA